MNVCYRTDYIGQHDQNVIGVLSRPAAVYVRGDRGKAVGCAA
jgi:hypothetical protein